MCSTRSLRGYLLVTTVLLVGLLFSLGLAVVQFSTHHQQWLRKAEATSLAREAARSGIQLALAEFSASPGWTGPLSRRLGEATADVEVHRNDGERPRMEADGRVLPAHCARLLSRGEARGSTAVYEALVSLPGPLYENEFNQSAAEWSQSLLQPVVLLGQYVLDLGLQAYAVTGDPAWRDYEAEFTATLSQGTGVGFLVRMSGELAAPNGYLVDYGLAAVRLLRLEQGRETLLARAPAPPGRLQNGYRIRADGGRLQVWLNSEPVLEYRDAAPLEQGKIGIRPLLGTVVLVDSVRVRQLLKVVSRWRR